MVMARPGWLLPEAGFWTVAPGVKSQTRAPSAPSVVIWSVAGPPATPGLLMMSTHRSPAFGSYTNGDTATEARKPLGTVPVVGRVVTGPEGNTSVRSAP